MSRFVKMFSLSVVVIALLMLGHSMMSPLPISAATTALGGLAALWLLKSHRASVIGSGAGLGAAIGAAVHAFSHVFVGHTHPHVHDAVAAHVVGDVTLGVLIGLAALALPIVALRLSARTAN
ncbi:MAG TPA: hypothetical protein P5081_23475 [Phycisphaerae bacterium]|nr:hypothetical protein [Phycisphaerae bacterium]HRW55844.1 hypothetical protein [Phycisphaerae bacterium]